MRNLDDVLCVADCIIRKDVSEISIFPTVRTCTFFEFVK